jgi:3-isopropylmalate/(R)-2-methylmalate dehydratase small subunit
MRLEITVLPGDGVGPEVTAVATNVLRAAPSFADIFRSNCLRNGLLPVELDEGVVDTIAGRAQEDHDYFVTVDLEALMVTDNRGLRVPFSIDPFRRQCLLNGWDDIELTLQHEEAILMYEKRRGIGA